MRSIFFDKSMIFFSFTYIFKIIINIMQLYNFQTYYSFLFYNFYYFFLTSETFSIFFLIIYLVFARKNARDLFMPQSLAFIIKTNSQFTQCYHHSDTISRCLTQYVVCCSIHSFISANRFICPSTFLLASKISSDVRLRPSSISRSSFLQSASIAYLYQFF